DHVVADDVRVRGRNVESADLRVLVGVARVGKDRASAGASSNHVLNIQVVVRVGRLKPGAAVVQIQMKRVYGREVVVHAVEYVLLVALVVEDRELWRIEKAPRVEAVSFDKIAPFLAAIGQIGCARRRSECAIRTADAAGRLGNSLTRARGGYNHEAGFVAVLGRRRARDDLNRLNQVRRQLVGKDLALLVGDRLAIDGKRVGGVIAEAVKEAVRVGCDAGRGLGDQRAQRG